MHFCILLHSFCQHLGIDMTYFDSKLEAITSLIHDADLSVSDLSKKSGITRSQIYRWLDGTTNTIHNSSFRKIMKAYAIDYQRVGDKIKLKLPVQHQKEATTMSDTTYQEKLIKAQEENIELLKNQLNMQKAQDSTIVTKDIFAESVNELDSWMSQIPNDFITIQTLYNSGDPYIFIADGNIAKVNKAFTALFGYSSNSLQGKTLANSGIAKNGNLKIFITRMKTRVANEKYCVSIYHKNGTIIPVSVRSFQSLTASGESVFVMKIAPTMRYWHTWGGYIFDENGEVPQLITTTKSDIIKEQYGAIDLPNKGAEWIHKDDIPKAFQLRNNTLYVMQRKSLVITTVQAWNRLLSANGEYIKSHLVIEVSKTNNSLESKVFTTPVSACVCPVCAKT